MPPRLSYVLSTIVLLSACFPDKPAAVSPSFAPVLVMGQVARSGPIRFAPGMTIIEAIARCGGFSPLAGKNSVRVTRIIGGKKLAYRILVGSIEEGRRASFQLMPGDEVFVFEAHR